jgi:hypothetical protein
MRDQVSTCEFHAPKFHAQISCPNFMPKFHAEFHARSSIIKNVMINDN